MEKYLNPLLFNNILPLLLLKKKFNEIIEISLISKSTFKKVQNLILTQSQQLNIILGSLSTFKSYIEVNSQGEYTSKLIQYKDIEYFNCRFDNSIFKRKEIDYFDHKEVYDSIKIFKEFLKEVCPRAKRVHLIKHVYAATYGRGLVDFTIDGFFSFDGLWISIDDDAFPVSNFDEEEKVTAIQNGEYQDQYKEIEVAKDETKITVRTFNYSYDLINNYNPKKVVMSYADELSGAYGIHIYNFDNVLKFKSIKSLKFNDQPTKPELIKKLIQSNSIESLQLNYQPNGDYGAEEDDEEIFDNNKDYSEELAKILEEGNLSGNKILRKLVFENWNTCIYRNPVPLIKLLNSIKNNTRLSKIDFVGFEIQDSNLLKPLIENPNISTLYYHFDELNEKRNDLAILDSYFIHLNQNPNIKNFKCILLYRYIKGHQHLQFNQLFEKFKQFFNSGNKSLEQIDFKINFDYDDFNLPKANEIKEKISNLLLSSNNKLLKLIWKFDNFTTRRY